MRPAAAPLSVEEHLSPERLAMRLNCSTSKIRKAIWRGELDAIRVGRLVRIPTSAAHRWLENHPAGGASKAVEN